MAKNLVPGPILVHLAQIQAANFFFKNLASSVTRYHSQLSLCTISEKTNDPILRRVSDRQTDRWTDGRTDGQKGCPTNIKHPTKKLPLQA